jgi:hypothetical protein
MLAPAAFGERHLTAIPLVIETRQMQNAMQHQDLYFKLDGMAEFRSLLASAIE